MQKPIYNHVTGAPAVLCTLRCAAHAAVWLLCLPRLVPLLPLLRARRSRLLPCWPEAQPHTSCCCCSTAAGLLDPPEEIKAPKILIIEGAPAPGCHCCWLHRV